MSSAIKRIGRLSYQRCKSMLVAKKRDKDCGEVTIGPNTRIMRCDEGNDTTYHIAFHGSFIVTFYADGRVILDSCGHKTTTTKQRIGILSGCAIHQKRYQWYATVDGVVVPFEDGMNVGSSTTEELLFHASRNGDTTARSMLADLHEDNR